MVVSRGRIEVDAAQLFREHPPRIRDRQKQFVFERAGGFARVPVGTIVVSRWAPGDLGPVGPRTVSEGVAGPFTYPRPPAGIVLWHLNFADPDLFVFYGGPLLAQDEMQVAEHPLLASVREALAGGAGFPPLTREADGSTPVLVRNVERWAAIDTNPALARPAGIYGNRFAEAPPDVLAQAVTRLDDAPASNILAMAAPQGTGRYAPEEIRDVLVTAVTGFAAAKQESVGQRVRIHTGHWGTGVFGGNRVLMAAAQLVAARIAGVDALAYHSLDGGGAAAFDEGRALADAVGEGASLDDVVTAFDARGFLWGYSDGN